MNIDISKLDLAEVVTAIGGLGTAAFGLVEAIKPVFGSINRMGLKHIQDTIASLTPDQTAPGTTAIPPNTQIGRASCRERV